MIEDAVRWRRGETGSSGRGRTLSGAICILLIEARRFTRESVHSLLANAAPDFTVFPVPCADDLNEASAKDIGIIMLNIGDAPLSDLRVSTQLQIVKKRLPKVPVVLLSDCEETSEVIEALNSGIRGYIPVKFGAHVIAEAVRLVHCGGTFTPANALKAAVVTPTDKQREAWTQIISTNSSWPSAERLFQLTSRQREVLHFLCEGEPNKRIAAAMNIHESTVKLHVREIMKKLGVTNRTRAALLAERLSSDSGSRH